MGVFDTAQLARHIGVPASLIDVWQRLGAGPPLVKIAGRAMYLEADVAAWLDNGAADYYGVEPGSRFVA